ncbi:LamG domain-containing protein [Micromonospora sp. NPDC050417]|uniref:LamG domain-containing protein n=1 Tax=Micromonospora sp. NPDC050417 TaxID=3364280 RepID=UPI0037896489
MVALSMVLGTPALAAADQGIQVSVTIDSLPDGPGKPATFTISSTEPKVTIFRYGWTAVANEVAATGTTIRSATVTLTVPSYGLNTLYVTAVDDNFHKGYGSVDFSILTPREATARWGLESMPGTTREQALADQWPGLGGATPLTGTNIGWANGARLIGAETVDFDGHSSYLSASPAVVDTAGTFAIAAWVRLTDTSVDRTLASMDGSGLDPLVFGYQRDTNRWSVRMPSKAASPQVEWAEARSTSVPKPGLWTHLAAVHNAADQTLKLYVNGSLEGTANGVTTFDDPAGEFRLGRSDSSWWQGNLRLVQVYDRALTTADFFGRPATDPESGGVERTGFFEPSQVGLWGFSGASSCYEESTDPLVCNAPDYSPFGRQLGLAQGSFVGFGHVGDGLLLDGTHWTDDPFDPYYGMATKEYGRSQTNIGEPGSPVWQDSPVLRTDQSFTVSVWAKLDSAQGEQTVVSQDSTGSSAFQLGYRPADGGEWVFKIRADPSGENDAETTYATVAALNPTGWHHLVGVLDATRSEARLYVDGALAQTVTLDPAWKPWQASGPLLVGRATTSAGPAEWLYGAVDDLELYQGVMSDGGIGALYDRQSW